MWHLICLQFKGYVYIARIPIYKIYDMLYGLLKFLAMRVGPFEIQIHFRPMCLSRFRDRYALF